MGVYVHIYIYIYIYGGLGKHAQNSRIRLSLNSSGQEAMLPMGMREGEATQALVKVTSDPSNMATSVKITAPILIENQLACPVQLILSNTATAGSKVPDVFNPQRVGSQSQRPGVNKTVAQLDVGDKTGFFISAEASLFSVALR